MSVVKNGAVHERVVGDLRPIRPIRYYNFIDGCCEGGGGQEDDEGDPGGGGEAQEARDQGQGECREHRSARIRRHDYY